MCGSTRHSFCSFQVSQGCYSDLFGVLFAYIFCWFDTNVGKGVSAGTTAESAGVVWALLCGLEGVSWWMSTVALVVI